MRVWVLVAVDDDSVAESGLFGEEGVVERRMIAMFGTDVIKGLHHFLVIIDTLCHLRENRLITLILDIINVVWN